MPKLSGKMNARERAICARLKTFRESTKWPVAAFAQALEASEHKLTSVEHGRTPLKCIDAILISEIFDLNLHWLVTGNGPMHGGQAILYAIDDGENPYGNRLLSEVFDASPDIFLPPSEFDNENFTALTPTPNFDPVSYLTKWIPVWFHAARFRRPFDAERLARKIEAYIQSTLAQYRQAGIAIRVKLSRHSSSMAVIPRDASAARPERQLALDEVPQIRDSRVVPVTMKQLLARVSAAAEATGKKAELASFLKVPKQRVSEWLAGKPKPNGETTLQLLHWVEQQERKK